MTPTNPDGAYGSGRRILDESKAASVKDYIAHLIAVAAEMPEGETRLAIEARIGRAVMELTAIHQRLANTQL